MLLQNRYNISERIIWLIGGICAMPFLLNLVGVNFGFVSNQIDLDTFRKLIDFESHKELQTVLSGRFLHVIFVSFSISIAFLTVILAFIDFRIKGEISTPIVGIALFCSGIFDTFHVLVSSNLLHVPSQHVYITGFTWFFCRLFHASILILGVSIFLLQSNSFREETIRNSRKFVFYIAVIFVLFTCITIAILFLDSNIPKSSPYPFRNIARPYDLVPLILYAFAAFYFLPKFYEKYPSVFSQTLLLSMIPAIATQLYMTFGSNELFDNGFNISHFMAAFTNFIPFIGLSLNYLQTHKNERKVIGQLNREAHERKVVEETLSGVLNSSLSSIMSFKPIRDSSGKIFDFEWTLLNPAAELLFGKDYRELYGKHLVEKIPSTQSEKWVELFSVVIETGEPLNHEYFSDHFQKWLLMVAVKLEDGLAVTINDISKRKNALEDLVRAEKLAVTGRLARTIAHEVRNPLTNINLSIEHLNGSTQEDHEMYIDIIKRNSERINQLITELLNSSKQAELKLARYPVNVLLDETIELAIDRIQLKEIKLKKNYCTDKAEINVDVAKMKTALLNLLINAVEAMEAGRGVLKISSSLVNHFCIITIEDNGSGIEPENMKRLFEPFFSKKAKGMGLGLTATQNIILTHQGTIDVSSDPGKGTTFTIRFSAA